MRYLIGIDAGTSNVKAVLFDENGTECDSASRESTTYRTSGNCVEQDMLAVWHNVRDCLLEIAGRNKAICSSIAGIGVTGQGEGFWAIDRDGNPVGNAMLWQDGRAVEVVERITKTYPEIGRQYHTTTGTMPLTGNQMILAKWVQMERTAEMDRVYKVFFCKDWIRYCLTGEISADLTDSMTSLLDANTYKRADELLKVLGLTAYRDIFPEPVRSDSVAGYLKNSVAEEVGLPAGLPVIAGALDTSATMIGLGAIHPGSTCVILGTTCACEVIFNKEDCAFGEGSTRFEKHPISDLFVNLQPTNNGTPNIDWLLENISLTKNFNEIDAIMDQVPVGCGGVVYLPEIGLSGERAPFYHPYARAEFFGISRVTTRNELIRAVYEGISLSIRDCLEEIRNKSTVYLAGGGAKSPVWAQMIADVLNLPIKIPSGEEQGAKGAAMMAGVSCGIYRDYEEAVEKACSFRCEYQPDPVRAAKYDLLYGLFRTLREHNQDVWTLRHQINKQMKAMDKED